MSAVTDIGKFQEAYAQGRIKLTVQEPGTYARSVSGGSRNRVVVVGHPEFTQEEARAVYDYVKKNPGNHNISKKGNTITIKTSSEDYIKNALKVNEEVIEEQKTQERTLNTPPVYSSGAGNPTTYTRANSSFTPAPPLAPEETIRKPVTFNTEGYVQTRNILQVETPTRQEQFLRDFNMQRAELKQQLFTNQDTKPVNLVDVETKLIIPGVILLDTGIAKGVVGAVKDVATLQIIPNTTNFLTEAVSNPKGVIREVGMEFKKNPLGFTGEQVAYGVVTGKVVGVVSKPGKLIKGMGRVYEKYETALIKTVEPNYPYKDLSTYKYVAPKKDYVVIKSKELLASDEAYYSQGRGVQTDLRGGLVTDVELQGLGLEIKKSPLGLDQTPFYNKPIVNQKINVLISKYGELKAKSSLVEANSVFDDVILTPEISVPVKSQVTLRGNDFVIEQNILSEKVFPSQRIGETTKTDFFDLKNPEIKTEKFKVDVKEVDVSKQKTLSDESGNLLYAQIVPSPIFELGRISYEEFKPQMRFKSGSDNLITRSVERNIRVPVFVPESRISFDGRQARSVIQIQQPVSVTAQNSLVLNKPESIVEYKFNPKSISEEAVGQRQVQRSNQRSKSILKYDQALERVQLTESVRAPISINEPKVYTPVRSKVPRVKEPRAPLFKLEKKQEAFTKPFRVEVRRKKKFLGVGEFGSEAEAFNFGKLIVGNSAGASLRVKNLESGDFEKNKNVLSDKQFYASQKEKGVYVERRSQRIKSSGEKQEISFKGLQALRNKRILN